MHRHYKGTILITTLIIIAIMTTLIVQIYQSLILMEKNVDADWQYSRQIESLRKAANTIINLSYWPTRCFKSHNIYNGRCTLNGFHYVIEEKKPKNCSVIHNQGHWRDALFYHIRVWQDNLSVSYFCRIAKADHKLTCERPLKTITYRIQSASIQPIKFNIRYSAL